MHALASPRNLCTLVSRPVSLPAGTCAGKGVPTPTTPAAESPNGVGLGPGETGCPLSPSGKGQCLEACSMPVARRRWLPRHLRGQTKSLREHVDPACGKGPGKGLSARDCWAGVGRGQGKGRTGRDTRESRLRDTALAPGPALTQALSRGPGRAPNPAPSPAPRLRGLAACPSARSRGPAPRPAQPRPTGLLGEVTSQRDGGGSFRQLKGDLGPGDPSPSAAGRGRAGPAEAGTGAAALELSHPPRIEALGAAGRPESDGESGAVRGAEPAAGPAVAAAAAPPPRAQTQEAAGRAGVNRSRRRRHGA